MKRTGRRPPSSAPAGEAFFLPSFCTLRMVFSVVVIAELLAFVLALAPGGRAGGRWGDLGLISLFIQWVALTSTAALCFTRPWLQRLPSRTAAICSYVLLLLVTALISEAAYWMSRDLTDLANGAGFVHGDFVLRNVAISAVISAVVLRYMYVQHQWRQKIQTEAHARIQALQSRIRPHFLFNSLNTIASLSRTQPEQAEEAVQDLADLFRATLGGYRDRVALREELEIARRYLHMESLRLGERLRVEWAIDGLPEHLMMPPLILQPLLENAIYHGVEPLAGGGVVRVSGRANAQQIVFEVINPLPPPTARVGHDGNRMALDNIRQRLELAYGTGAGITAGEHDDEYRVRVQIPRDMSA